MNTIKLALFTLVGIFFLVTNTNAQNMQDIEVAVQKATGKIEVINKANHTTITAQYEIKTAEMDIYNAKGEYVGSLQLANGTLPTAELSAGETLKAVNLQIVEKASGKLLEFKDMKVALQ